DHRVSSTRWVRCYQDNIPDNAVVGGTDKGEDLFVGRARHNGGLLPGKVHRSHRCCYVAYYGREHKYEDYEVLVNDGASLTWVRDSNGSVPKGAIPGGHSADGETLYIGRSRHEGTVTVGKVLPSHGSLYLAYYGCEHRYNGYEVLVDGSMA
ncbi:hypothetical protein V5799_023158, partial [Amblyomma americanum]